MLIGKHHLAILISTCLSVSCGYRFTGPSQLPSGIRHVYMEVLENRSGETGIESVLTNDIIDEIIRSGNAVSKDRSVADAVLSGRIADLYVDTATRKSAHRALEGRVTLRLDLELISAKGEVVWSASGMSASEAYDIVTNDKPATEQNRRRAIEEMSKRLAEAVLDDLASTF